MSFNCKGKVVLVTGASSGIGREVALCFGREGAKVALVARNIDALDQVKARILEEGGYAESFPCDLKQYSDLSTLVESIDRHFGGPVTLLVNNAGVVVLGRVDEVPVDGFSDNLVINFLAPVALVKAVLPGMKKKGYGQIINISSGCGWRGLPEVAAYSASKFALNGFTESLRVELAPFSIQVIAFSPGRVDTGIEERGNLFGAAEHRDDGPSQSPEAVAQKILMASKNSKRETILSFKVKVAIHLNYWLPGLLDFLLIRAGRNKPRCDRSEK
jgi:dehydrogenase/reductase SDR family member 7B